jgi:hypothetical protein
VGIRAGRVVAGRLVQRQVEGRRSGRDRPAIHHDGRLLRINFRPKRGDGLAVDLHAAGQYKRFGVAPGRDAGGGENLL